MSLIFYWLTKSWWHLASICCFSNIADDENLEEKICNNKNQYNGYNNEITISQKVLQFQALFFLILFICIPFKPLIYIWGKSEKE